VPDEKAATGRIIVGTLTLLISANGLAHLLNGSAGTGATAIREGGGWIGYAVSTPLVALMTSMLTYPVLVVLFVFGILVVTATPASEVFSRISGGLRWLWDRKPARRESDEEFEISETPPFESPVVADWNSTAEDEEELDEEEFDEEFTVAMPKPTTQQIKKMPDPSNSCFQVILIMNYHRRIFCALGLQRRRRARLMTALLPPLRKFLSNLKLMPKSLVLCADQLSRDMKLNSVTL